MPDRRLELLLRGGGLHRVRSRCRQQRKLLLLQCLLLILITLLTLL